ncbi:MAG TPA: crossover junction endodeoxyribonuclease RuvC [Puia sp.]|nr:crossover junction endodeoxyribonuclease RuvC [Puia sp.]
MQTGSKIILGIDPGTLMMGFGIVRIKNSQLSMLEMGVLKLSSRKNPHERLQMIHHRVMELIDAFQPTEFAIEAPFFGKNVQSMLKLGRAQGVAIAAAIQTGLQVTEYSPRKIKQSITGNGNADKNQVWKMLQHLLSLKEEIFHYDASDALAVAVCHHFQNGKGKNGSTKTSSKTVSGWNDFIQKNPHRIGGK